MESFLFCFLSFYVLVSSFSWQTIGCEYLFINVIWEEDLTKQDKVSQHNKGNVFWKISFYQYEYLCQDAVLCCKDGDLM